MTLIDYSRRFFFPAIFAGVLSLTSNAATMPRVAPLQTRVTFSAQSGENWRAIPIKSTTGKTVYVLSLEPYFEIKKHITGIDLVLRHPGDEADAPNLLEPTGRWHGLQAYDFAGGDFAQGVQKSAFGEKRTVTLKNLGLVVRIAVSKAIVRPVSGGYYQFDALELQIEVDNLNP